MAGSRGRCHPGFWLVGRKKGQRGGEGNMVVEGKRRRKPMGEEMEGEIEIDSNEK